MPSGIDLLIACLEKRLADLQADLVTALREKNPHVMAHKVRQVAEDLGVEVCEYCLAPAEPEVTWYDRRVTVCAGRLPSARHAAANDNTRDRTDNPRIRPV